MASKKNKDSSLPVAAMFFIALISGAVVAGSFEIINYWPLPVSIAPYYGWGTGLGWGLCAGALFGYILGWLTDDNHFEES